MPLRECVSSLNCCCRNKTTRSFNKDPMTDAESVLSLTAKLAAAQAINAEQATINAELATRIDDLAAAKAEQATRIDEQATRIDDLATRNAALAGLLEYNGEGGTGVDAQSMPVTMHEFLHPPVKYAYVHAETSTVLLEQKIIDVARSKDQTKHFVVVNSTGNGKTYACIQLGKSEHLKSLYVLCAQHGTGYKACPEVEKIARTIKGRKSLDEKNVIALSFVRHLQKKMQRADRAAISAMQFEEENYLGLSKLLEEDELKPICNAEPANFSPQSSRFLEKMGESGGTSADLRSKRLKYVTFEDESESVPDAVKTRASTSTSGSPSTPLVIIFDEADGLLLEVSVNNEECPLRCIQRACDACGIVSIYLSTTSRVQRIHSMAISLRRPLRTFIEPFIEVVQHDLYQDHLFHLGRPLWFHNWENQCGKDYRDLVNLAKAKIVGKLNGDKETAKCALFALRFGMRPSSAATETFVSNHMAILTHLEPDMDMENDSESRFTGTCCWLSEPILAEASCFLTTYDKLFSRKIVLSTIRQKLDSGLIAPSVGDKGEVLAAALFGFTMDVLRESVIQEVVNYNPNSFGSSMSAPISLVVFLRSIGLQLRQQLIKALDGYYVNFTHFQRLDRVMDVVDCAQAVRRCLAFYTPAGSAAVDIVIVGFNLAGGTSRYVPVRCQVKNLKEKVTFAAAKVLLHAMSPTTKCQPELSESCVEIGIVLAIGSGGADHQISAVVSSGTSTTITRSQTKGKALYHGFLINIDTKKEVQKSNRFFPLLSKVELATVKSMAESHTFDKGSRVYDGFRNHRETVSNLLQRFDLDTNVGVQIRLANANDAVLNGNHFAIPMSR